MDFQAVGAPTNYGAPQVFGQQGGQQQDPGQQVAGVLQKAKQLLSQGLISADQYNQITSQYGQSPGTELATSAGNMGQGMPGGGQPLNILPGQGG